MPLYWSRQMVRLVLTVVGECGRCYVKLCQDIEVFLFIYLVFAPCLTYPPQGCLAMVINWTPTTGLVSCQVQSGSAHGIWSPLSREKSQEDHKVNTLGFYFSLISEVLNRTISHMFGSWYFPMFLFRNGSLTSMKMASFIVLASFWASFPTVLTFWTLVWWPLVLKN